MTHGREKAMEDTVAVEVRFRRDTLEKITEAARSLGLAPAQYIGIASVTAARDDLARADRLRMATENRARDHAASD